MAEQPIEIPIKISGINNFKRELKELKAQIINSTDPVEMERLAKRAGELTDSIRDANEQVNIFAGGSGFEKVSNNLGDIGGKLRSLDFAGAGESAKLLANNIASINPAEITEQMQGLTTTFSQLGKAGGMAIGGLIKNVGAMAKAFFSFGVSLMANPIFLITAAIVALVGIIAVIMNKLGILQPVLDGIGWVFGLIGDAIDAVIQSIKDFLDMIGLTDYAGEEMAKKEAARLDMLNEKRKDAHTGLIRGLDEEIKIRKANGKDTEALELEKQKAILKTAQMEFDANNFKINNAKFLKTLSEEEIKTLKKNYKESKEVLLQAKSDLRVFQAEQEAEQKQKEEQANAKAKENAKAQRERANQYAKDRLDAQRLAKDLELSLMDDGFMKERAKVEEQLKRQLFDIERNAKLTYDEKKKQTELYTDLAAIEDKKIVAAEELRQKEIENKKNEANEIVKQNEIARANDLQNTIDEITESNFQRTLTEREREIQAVNDKYFLLEESAIGNAEALVEIEKAKNFELAEINKKQQAEDLQNYAKTQDAKKQITQAVFDGIAALGSIFIKDQKKLEKLNKASALVQIGIDTAKAISALIANSSANPANAVTGGLAGIAQYATGIVQILTNVAKAKAILSSGSASAGGGGATASGGTTQTQTPVQSATPQVNLFGGANQFNNVGGQQSVQGGQVIKAVVSETEITNSQNRINRFEQLASL
jgi:hypothetical protein